MKNKFLLFAFALGVFFTACDDDDVAKTPNQFDPSEYTGAYFFNYGGNNGSVTKYQQEDTITTNNYFKSQNNDRNMLSKVQYAYEYKDSIYMMGNSSDQIFKTNLLFEQTTNGVTEKIENPRFCVGHGDYLYISCLGAKPDWSIMPNSYVAKYNVTTDQVEEKIMIPGGPEGLEIAHNKLYVALNYADSLAIVDLNNTSADPNYIKTPAVSSYFVKDNNNNLYVSFVSTFSATSDKAGLGYINTQDNSITSYPLPGISSGYSSVLYPSNDFSKIYVIAAGYDENWVIKGGVQTFDVATKQFTPFVENLTGVNGVSVDPETDNVYVFGGASTSENGFISIYQEDGTHVRDLVSGISPYWSLFL